jgi:2-dehydro-3-deoxyphosphooctonate aldolase (KDO 8-P synthase)
MENEALSRTVVVGSATFGSGNPFVLIAGPCVIENERHPFFMAREITAIARDLGIPLIFKASLDKANRTSGDSFRGPGFEAGLAILGEVRKELGVAVTTDVHETHQVGPVAEVVDLLQIPAFLCRQTDLILEAGRSGKPVNIKKGQFLAPWDVFPILEKAYSTGNRNVLVTERGTSFGYNNLVVDMRGFPILKDKGVPVVFDVTHSLQLPGASGTSSGGQSQFIRQLASAGVAAGVDGIFMEVHESPAKALSDGPNACPLDQLSSILKRLLAIQKAIGETP